jgi:drug/metabolite transporter (DMT)-like permease
MDVSSNTHPDQRSAGSKLSRKRDLFGAGLVVLSTATIAVVPTFAKLAFDGGSDTLTVITARSMVTAAVCLILLVVLGRPLNIARRPLWISLALGVLYAAHLYGLLGAVTYLPVNMVILIFFLHPLIIGVIAILTGHETMSLLRFGALSGAIVGLSLAVGFSFGNLDLAGMALALMAAVMAAVVIVCSSLAMKGSDSLAVTYYMMLSAAVTLVVFSLVQGDLKLPVTSRGWTGFGGVAIAYTVGTVTFFGAIPLLGAVRAAMITNLEPVLGILFAMMILGERISLIQGLGIVMVITSIFAMEIARPSMRR